MDDIPMLVSKRVRIENCEDAINSTFIKFGWSDGLPRLPVKYDCVNVRLCFGWHVPVNTATRKPAIILFAWQNIHASLPNSWACRTKMQK